jgi:DNA-binding response OmpR family regulator
MKKKVLLVDDDRVFSSITKKKLSKHGDTFLVLTAHDGKHAVEKLNKNTISLVVTDLEMPNMDGFELLAYLTSTYPDIPVIILTAHGSQESEQVVLKSGGSGLIHKPVKIDLLARAIIAFLRRESEGGVFKANPLKTYVELIEKEKKTCTIRVVRRSTGQKGTLFFRDGELLLARIHQQQGTAAALHILSWHSVVLSLQNSCAYKNKQLDADLGTLLAQAERKRAQAQQATPSEGAA